MIYTSVDSRRRTYFNKFLDQQAFLLELERKQTDWNMDHPKVRSASGKLLGAYGNLMRMYPNEDGTNRQAFFDYLCALDFI